jgi:hypothetical protein
MLAAQPRVSKGVFAAKYCIEIVRGAFRWRIRWFRAICDVFESIVHEDDAVQRHPISVGGGSDGGRRSRDFEIEAAFV